MLRWIKRIAWFAGLGLLGFGLLLMSIPVSRVDDGGNDFEMQVVLGGNSRKRSEVSHQLWLRHPTPILVTGDANFIRDELLRLGVPESEIIHESQARNTWQNAEFSMPILRDRGINKAVIVTSWFHTGRAYGCFTQLEPAMRFTTSSDRQPDRYELDDWKVSIVERFKSVYYWLGKGVNPWKLN
jgi:uncharacterized SAM-binding protein YcdF (DUF218 family)